MPASYLPGREADLVTWLNELGVTLNDFAAFGLTSAQATEYETAKNLFVAAHSVANNPATRTSVTIAEKDALKSAVISLTRRLVNQMQCWVGMTDAKRQALKITVRKTPTSIPVPAMSPTIEVLNVKDRVAEVSVSYAGKRRFPPLVKGVNVFIFVGAQPPTDPTKYEFIGGMTKTKLLLPVEQTPAGNTAWVTMQYFNEKAQAGIGCTPVRIDLPEVPQVPQQKSMKLAA